MNEQVWINADRATLATDLYEFTMAQAYWLENMNEEACFSLYVRELPRERGYLIACGIQSLLETLSRWRFSEATISELRGFSQLRDDFLDWLRDVRFSGEIRAVAEGTPVFGAEPILEVRAPLIEGQLLETLILNQIQLPTMAASKARRMVEAAAGRPVVDFGLRRAHSVEAGVGAAAAYHVAGLAGTSNVLAASAFDIPASGTMAHAYVQAHEDEFEAFRQFALHYPATTLLVDTYDTLAGVDKAIRLYHELPDKHRFAAIRLDSGDLGELAMEARKRLDKADMQQVRILASSGLDEHAIAALRQQRAPIDGFGVGTSLATCADAPNLEIVYKLTELGGRARMKLSSGKQVLPGPKQVFRAMSGATASGDTIACADERLPGRPLLQRAMCEGQIAEGYWRQLDQAREYCESCMQELPESVRELDTQSSYPVSVSERLAKLRDTVSERLQSRYHG